MRQLLRQLLQHGHTARPQPKRTLPTKCTSRHHATPALRRQNHLHYVTRPAPTGKTGALQRCISAPAPWRSAPVPPAAAPPSARMCTGHAATLDLARGIHKLHHPPAIHPCVSAANGTSRNVTRRILRTASAWSARHSPPSTEPAWQLERHMTLQTCARPPAAMPARRSRYWQHILACSGPVVMPGAGCQ